MTLRPPLSPLAMLLFMACKATPTPTDPPPTDTGAFEETACGEASASLGVTACRHTLFDAADLEAVASAAPEPDIAISTKFLVPVDDAPLPTVFMNTREFPLHHDFLVQAFPELYGTLTPFAYLDLIFGAEKQYLAGSLSLYEGETGPWLGFTVWEDPGDPSTALAYIEVRAAWRALQEQVRYADIAFVPTGSQIDRIGGWDAEFPIAGVDLDLQYEPYTQAVGYGTLRRFTLTELASASESASFGFQDVLLLEEAPFDLERVVSGVITGTRQAPLSHLNVRSAARGTPNCFVANGWDDLASFDGQLVRLTCGAEGATVEPTTLTEAEAFWESLRPEPVEVPEPDRLWSSVDALPEIPTSTPEERATAVARFGSKATNLAVLYDRIDPALSLDGLAIPMFWYEGFLDGNTASLDVGAGPQVLTFRAALDAMLADPVFLSDPLVRQARLGALQVAMQGGDVDPALLELLATRITAVWGSDEVVVRFRSSSNAEDALGFTGAGLYTSASGCIADDLDGDVVGPSHCEPDRADERTVADALALVWASAWSVKAWEERAWYGIPPERVAMGVLGNDRSQDEAANIVAFTGDPVGSSDRWMVNAQAGEGSVVSPDPDEVPESTLLELTDGEVTRIIRVSASSEVPVGVSVLPDARLNELGAALWDVQEVFPIDATPPAGFRVLLDTEWKVLADGRLIVKQVRPFLDPE